ncbi:hypothetical protein J1N35_023800 [Gossypium stocksii]|uniref:AAA+ ATPase domain-containing protein n=1 Tax=Gossypium stocksii TaxID=47602 RepID=A0A9D4A4R0_9ROSI|nr:hypothetical protein J1N35_023800 [Gossypium stocksii]
MAWSAVASALTTIGNLLTQEAIYLWDVEEQVDRLQTELKWMQSSLMEAEAQQSKDERIRLWVAEIRELAYDAEDVVEEFALKIGFKSKGGLPGCTKKSTCIVKKGWALHETKSKIEKIIARIIDLVRRLQAYGVRELKDGREGSSSSTEMRELRRPYPHVMDDNFVGLVDVTKELISVLKDERSDECSRVVSICGMGGLGKTTLAKKIFHHHQVIHYFNHLAFVYVSQQFLKRKVWEDILSGFKILNDEDRKKSDEDLACKLFKILKDKKCLVILDDIWDNRAWDILKGAFPVARDDHGNSKILLTSRNKAIVSHADGTGYLCELQCLNDEQSWELFRKIAFPTENIIGMEVKELGENIVKHCAGLPLAIIVLGGILATKNNSLNEWQKISDNVKSYLKRGKIQGPEDALALSYDDLPPYLKPCFLYLSHFPEDYMIDVDRLIQLWVAEGIASSKQEERDGGEIAEDVAESYLMELVERCMIQVRERHVATLKVKTIQMHDLMRDLCLSKAKQENFVFIVDRSNASSLPMIRKFFSEKVLEKSLSLEVLNNVEEHKDEVWNPLYWILATPDLINMTNLRELVITGAFNIENFNEESGENPPIIGSKYLHSLSIGDYLLARRINPRHLAHLLSGCTSICKLSINAELKCCGFEKDPMPTLEKLPNLRILEFELSFERNEMFCSAQGFPRLESLSLMGECNLEEWKVDEGAMPSLQQLEIRRCPRLKMLPEGLRFITTLKELKIESMPKAFKDKLEEGGEDFYKVKHVPSIIFRGCDL